MAVDPTELAFLGWEHPKHSSRVGTVDTSGMAAGIAGSAIRGTHSTDHIVANTLNIVDPANTADTELHPNMDHMPVPVRRGCPRQAKPAR